MAKRGENKKKKKQPTGQNRKKGAPLIKKIEKKDPVPTKRKEVHCRKSRGLTPVEGGWRRPSLESEKEKKKRGATPLKEMVHKKRGKKRQRSTLKSQEKGPHLSRGPEERGKRDTLTPKKNKAGGSQ